MDRAVHILRLGHTYSGEISRALRSLPCQHWGEGNKVIFRGLKKNLQRVSPKIYAYFILFSCG